MKKIYNVSVFYLIVGLIGGVFYREFTKFNQFEGQTSLSVVHTHALMLGMFFFLILLVLEKSFHLTHHRHNNKFLIFYNIGLVTTIIMLVVRGIIQVLNLNITSAMSSMVSGIAGLGHICLGIGFIFFFIMLKHQLMD